jgi:hypothetical protein
VGFKNLGASGVVVDLVRVLAAIQLDNDVGVEAGEIDEKSIYRDLPAELAAGNLAIADDGPQSALGLGRLVAQIASAMRSGFEVGPFHAAKLAQERPAS